MDVQLYVYDLSKGLARLMSMGLVGIQIDAVYHTSIVLGGVEYFYGAGVQTCYPGATHHGQPMEIVPLGRTELPMDVILTYLESLKEVYTHANYDLFTHNCNNFSNDFAIFLVGKGIPDHITSLPQQVLNTPFGQMLKPQIDASMRSITQAAVAPENNPTVQAEAAAARDHRAHPNRPPVQPANTDAARAAVENAVQQAAHDHETPHKQPRKLEVRNGASESPEQKPKPRKLELRDGRAKHPKAAESAEETTPSPKKQPRKIQVRDSHNEAGIHGSVHNVTQLSPLESLLSSAKNSCAVLFFTSSTCAPCKIAYPTYDALAAEHPNVAFVKIDINQAQDIGSRYQIRATPTFMTFLHGQKNNEWSGANPTQLRANVDSLLQQAFPQHSHLQVRAPTLQFGSLKPITYSRFPPLEKLTAKMGERATDPAVLAIKDFLSERTTSGPGSKTVSGLPDLPMFARFLRDAPSILPAETLFTAYDLLRCALTDPRVSNWFVEESAPEDSETLSFLLSQALDLIREDKCPYNLRLVAIQMASNIFTSPLFAQSVLAQDRETQSQIPALMSKLTSESLLAEPDKPAIRGAAAGLAFNLAVTNYRIRREETREALPESSQVELAAGLLELINTEIPDGTRSNQKEHLNAELLKSAVTSFGYLVYCAPGGTELADLCAALDAQATISRVKDVKDAGKVASDVVEILSKEW